MTALSSTAERRIERATATILIVDDEVDLVELLAELFTREGHRTLVAHDGKEALHIAQRSTPDLVLVDWMLPEMSGIEVLKRLRATEATSAIPVILLTARREEVDRLLGLELGADDYVVKPFSPRELLLRARAVLHRSARTAAGAARVVQVGPIEVDLDAYRATVEGEPIVLTITEFRLLADLAQARGRVRTRDRLLSDVWGYDSAVLSRTVDTHVRRLRDKLGRAAAWVETVRGVGYRIRDPEAAS
jgi:two-component system phosphate regulon response regulator PhoB